MRWGSRSYLHFNKKGRQNKPLVWSGHTAFSSSQLQPCCRVLVMAILEYKLFTCSNTQTTAGIQVFFPPPRLPSIALFFLFFFFSLHCTSVCLCLDVSARLIFLQLCQAGGSGHLDERQKQRRPVRKSKCTRLASLFRSAAFVFRRSFAEQISPQSRAARCEQRDEVCRSSRCTPASCTRTSGVSLPVAANN